MVSNKEIMDKLIHLEFDNKANRVRDRTLVLLAVSISLLVAGATTEEYLLAGIASLFIIFAIITDVIWMNIIRKEWVELNKKHKKV